MNRRIYINYFDSIMVRLRRSKNVRSGEHLPFQFHNGTIKSLGENESVIDYVLFQFHNGTIKTMCLSIPSYPSH